MERIVPILLLWLSACGGEPLSEAIRRRSVYGVYADDFAEEYEPVAVAAFPLHQPVPVLRLLTAPSHSAPSYAAPTRPSTGYSATSYASIGYPQPKRSVPRPQPPREHRDQYVYAATEPEYAYSYEDSYEQPAYAPSATHSKYAKYPSASYEEYEAPTPVVVYARPNKNGGYSYRQKPARPQAKPQEPMIIRVHKYKIVRE